MNSTGTVVAGTATNSSDNDESVTFNAPVAGTYYLRVYNTAATPVEVPYFMQFRQNVATLCPEDGFEPNNNFGGAAPITVIPGTYALGSCNIGAGSPAEDYYSITVPNAGPISIVFYFDEVAMPASLNITSSNPANSQLFIATSSTNRFEYNKTVAAGETLLIGFSNGGTGYDGYFMTVDN